MKSPLTVSVLVKNNEDTIEECLESISFLNCNIQVGDLGCRDRTINKCLPYNPEIIRLSLNDDLSSVRNEMLERCQTEWFMVLNPYERFLSGQDMLLRCVAGPSSVYKLSVLQNDLITKETRLWNKNQNLKFRNPVYETVGNHGAFMPIFLNSLNKKNNIDKFDLCKKWIMKNPIVAEPIYYMACTYLTQQNWDAFINYAEMYLHQESRMEMPYYMTHYYLAIVNCYIKKNFQSAIQSITNCIVKKPMMAEFWCLLGDIYYSINDYDKAYHFFQNAILLGQRRTNDCEWFTEISKYKEYPEKMMQACISTKKQTSVYLAQ